MSDADRPLERMTLREILTQIEKRSRELTEFVHGQYLPKIGEMNELSRSYRRKSHFPTLQQIDNSIQRVEKALASLRGMTDAIAEHLRAIDERISEERGAK
jgi:hypothetical protein